MRTANIDVTKIDKTAIFHGSKGKYIDLVFFDNREGRDQYGNDGFVAQGVSKERREAGERGPILGNWKELDQNGGGAQAHQSQPATATTTAAVSDEDDDIPF